MDTFLEGLFGYIVSPSSRLREHPYCMDSAGQFIASNSVWVGSAPQVCPTRLCSRYTYGSSGGLLRQAGVKSTSSIRPPHDDLLIMNMWGAKICGATIWCVFYSLAKAEYERLSARRPSQPLALSRGHI